jgi:hypothetical protein
LLIFNIYAVVYLLQSIKSVTENIIFNISGVRARSLYVTAFL